MEDVIPTFDAHDLRYAAHVEVVKGLFLWLAHGRCLSTVEEGAEYTGLVDPQSGVQFDQPVLSYSFVSLAIVVVARERLVEIVDLKYVKYSTTSVLNGGDRACILGTDGGFL